MLFIYSDLYLNQVFKNPTLCQNAPHCSVVNSTCYSLQLLLTVSGIVCRIHNLTEQCLIFQPSWYRPFLSSISIHSSPVSWSLESCLANCGHPHPGKQSLSQLPYDQIFPKAHPPIFKAVPSADIVGTSSVCYILQRQKVQSTDHSLTLKFSWKLLVTALL